MCKCECKDKKEIIVSGNSLRSGNTKSCGCLQREGNNIKHGHNRRGKVTKIYKVWHSMIQRCTNPNHKMYKYYGGRGITVCDEWMEFPNFERDNPDWEPGLTIERDNNELGYFKGNCYWATRKGQQRNRRNTLYVPYNGEQRLLVELCEEHNMPYGVVYMRIYKYDWSIKRALITPVRKRRKNAR